MVVSPTPGSIKRLGAQGCAAGKTRSLWLHMIARNFCGGPVRVETIAAGLSVVALLWATARLDPPTSASC